ncbi:tetratricopeptide repeat protein [Thiospirochaeta perfilievii]|uniref:Tetratricopeptide repeat protein n=2 Tax=Thiospirochaeta perfilievii TaxID=252967 RepID=A0A5C1QEJ0_9SPIO|nr:tetratricopeptide repeat protein [Thiospirochaeta perfilievii]
MSSNKILIVFYIIIMSNFCFAEVLVDNDMVKGIDYYSKKSYLDSVYHFNLVIAKNNKLLNEAYYWKAKALYELNLYDQSKSTLELFFRKATIQTSYYEDSRFLYCKIFYKLKKYDDALLLFNQFTRNKSFNFYANAAIFWIGETYLQLSNLKLAKKSFEQYLKIYPDNKIALNRITNIDNILSIMEKKNSSDKITTLDKASWLSEYVSIEQKEATNSDKKYISNFLDSFENKDEFFDWLSKYYLVDKKNEKSSDKENIIKVEDKSDKPMESSELDYIEKALLDELEMKVLEELGVSN